MKYSVLLLIVFSLQGCQDERDCYTFLESECECNERQGRNDPYCGANQYQIPPGVLLTVGVYRCLSNQATLDQSRMPLINAGLDVKLSRCATLNEAVADGADACPDGHFTDMDTHLIPWESLSDAQNLDDFNYQFFGASEYTVKECI